MMLKAGTRVWIDVKAGDNDFYYNTTGRGFGILEQDTFLYDRGILTEYQFVSLVDPLIMDNGTLWRSIPAKSVTPVDKKEAPKTSVASTYDINRRLQEAIRMLDMAENTLITTKNVLQKVFEEINNIGE